MKVVCATTRNIKKRGGRLEKSWRGGHCSQRVCNKTSFPETHASNNQLPNWLSISSSWKSTLFWSSTHNNGAAHGGSGQVPLATCHPQSKPCRGCNCMPHGTEALPRSQAVPRRSRFRDKVVLLPVGPDCLQHAATICQPP